MLKISVFSGPQQVTLRLAGRVSGDWVGELQAACEMSRAEHGHVVLDFADVLFVDRAGAAVVRRFRDQGMSLVNCSPFITEQLRAFSKEKHGESSYSK